MSAQALLLQIDRWVRDTAPVTVTLAIVVLGAAPWPFPASATFSPMLSLIAVYFWAQRRPRAMTPWVAFAVGLIVDILAGTPIGMNALVFVLVHALVTGQRRSLDGKPLVLAWGVFAVVAVAASLTKWGLASINHLTLVGFGPVLAQLWATILLYPLAAWLLGRVDGLLADDMGEQ